MPTKSYPQTQKSHHIYKYPTSASKVKIRTLKQKIEIKM